MNDQFICVPFTSDINHLDKIKDFVIDREADYSNNPDEVIGLESYLKRCAWEDDLAGEVKIYLVNDVVHNSVVAYFGLKAGMVVDNEAGIPSEEEKKEVMEEYGAKLVSAVTPGIEISHFAVNDNYRRQVGTKDNPIKGLGSYIYPAFIYPLIEEVASKIGVRMIYLYAAGDAHLISYYENVFGFHMAEYDDFYMPLQPGYDGDCTFMYQIRE